MTMIEAYDALIRAAGLPADIEHDDAVAEIAALRAIVAAQEAELAAIDRRLCLDLPGLTRTPGDRVGEIDRRLGAADEEIRILWARLRPAPVQRRRPVFGPGGAL